MADPWPSDDTSYRVYGGIAYYNTSTTSHTAGDKVAYKVEPEEDEHADDRQQAKEANKMLSYLLDRKRQTAIIMVMPRGLVIKQPKPRSEFVAWRYK